MKKIKESGSECTKENNTQKVKTVNNNLNSQKMGEKDLDKNFGSHKVSTLMNKENQRKSTSNYEESTKDNYQKSSYNEEEYPDFGPYTMDFTFKSILNFLVKKGTDFYIFTEKELENIVKGFSKDHQRIFHAHLDWLEVENNFIQYEIVQENKGSLIYPIWLTQPELNNQLAAAGVIKTKSENARIFKMKAKQIQDFMNFFINQPRSIWNINIEYELVHIVLEFTTNMSLEEILLVLKGIEDGHVMMETVNYIEKYTGDRIFGDWHKITDDENLISILNGESLRGN